MKELLRKRSGRRREGGVRSRMKIIGIFLQPSQALLGTFSYHSFFFHLSDYAITGTQVSNEGSL